MCSGRPHEDRQSTMSPLRMTRLDALEIVRRSLRTSHRRAAGLARKAFSRRWLPEQRGDDVGRQVSREDGRARFAEVVAVDEVGARDPRRRVEIDELDVVRRGDSLNLADVLEVGVVRVVVPIELPRPEACRSRRP